MSTPSLFRLIEPATPAMSDDMTLPFSFPAVRGKKVTAAFDGGRLSSDGGVMLLAAAARRMGIAEKLAAVIPDRRDPTRVIHPLADTFRQVEQAPLRRDKTIGGTSNDAATGLRGLAR